MNQEQHRIFLHNLARAYQEQASDSQHQEEVTAWDAIVSGGLPEDWAEVEDNAYNRLFDNGKENVSAETFLSWLSEQEAEGGDQKRRGPSNPC